MTRRVLSLVLAVSLLLLASRGRSAQGAASSARGMWRCKMNPTSTKLPCLDPDWVAPHVVPNGRLKGRRRYHCKGCGAWFGETHDAPMYRLRTPRGEGAWCRSFGGG